MLGKILFLLCAASASLAIPLLSKTEICSLPPIENKFGITCRASILSWTFNSETGKCESYVYGGCGKTANLFESEGACLCVCGSEPDCYDEETYDY